MPALPYPFSMHSARPPLLIRRLALVLALDLLYACTVQEPAPWQGYVEGEYRYLSSTGSGVLSDLAVARGMSVSAGTVLFAIDATAEHAEISRLTAQQAQQSALLRNLQSGQRPDELAVLRAQLAQAKSQLKQSTAQWQRAQTMARTQLLSAEQVDAAQSGFERDRERLSEVNARLRVAKLGARQDEISAARAALAALDAALAQAQWRLAQKQVHAPSAGLIHDTLYQVGEVVPSARPVIILLPERARKIRFFIPEHERTQLALDQLVSLRCDACPPDLNARINYFSEQIEFTPPVLFNRDNRQELMLRVEALPTGAYALPIGLPVEVRRMTSTATEQSAVIKIK